MPNSKLSKQILLETLRVYAVAGSQREAADIMGIPRGTFQSRLYAAQVAQLEGQLEELDDPSPESEFSSRVLKIQGELKTLQDENASLKQRELNIGHIKEIIHGHSWEFKPKKWKLSKSQHGLTGVPISFWSDWHWDEVVFGEQINFVNAYSREIAVKRARILFEKIEELLMHHMANPKYEYMVVVLGGDMVSGNIHDELMRTNQEPIMKTVLSVVDTLIDGLTRMINVFGRVKVKCIFGNHGRLEQKKRYKQRPYENFDWLISHLLARHFGKEDAIEFEITDSTDLLFDVYNTRYLLTHGDEFKGGDSFSGPYIPWMKGQFKRTRRQVAIHDPYDVMLIGHWHQYNHFKNLVVNGTLKGLDELAFARGYDFEPPQQAMWVEHPVLGITVRWPVFCYTPGEKYS